MLGLHRLVVDGDLLPLDVLADDGEHRGLLAGQGDRVVDRVLEEVAQGRCRRRVADGAGREACAEFTCDVRRVLASVPLPSADRRCWRTAE